MWHRRRALERDRDATARRASPGFDRDAPRCLFAIRGGAVAGFRARGETHQSSRPAAATWREAREPETVARAGAAKAALEPAKFALAPRTARTAATEEVVRAAIFDEEVNVCGSCAGMPPAEADGAA